MLDLRIILGDNDSKFLVNTSLILNTMGYRVMDTDTSGTSLIRKIRQLNPDLVIADVNLRGISGFDISDIVEGERICPCIITFKNSPLEYELKLQKKLVYSYVQKPINAQTIGYAVENAYFTFKKLMELENKIKERKIVEKAKSLLMGKYNMSEERAYEYMRKKSMDNKTSMHKIALTIMDIINKKDIQNKNEK